MRWPLIQKRPKSNTIFPFFASLSELPGSNGRKTPTTPMPPVARTDFTRSFMVDRKSTRLNSSHLGNSYAVFCSKKKTRKHQEFSVRATEPARRKKAHLTEQI